MIGSAAATLTGLVFVVITLVSRTPGARTDDGLATFTTPTVLHFCGALLISAIAIAPWRSLLAVAVLVGAAGLYGVLHMVYVMRRARRLSTYDPDLEDWICYTILPFIAYGALCGGAIGLATVPVNAMFAVAGGVIVLVFTGIHNAWDVVTFLVTGGAGEPPASDSPGESG